MPCNAMTCSGFSLCLQAGRVELDMLYDTNTVTLLLVSQVKSNRFTCQGTGLVVMSKGGVAVAPLQCGSVHATQCSSYLLHYFHYLGVVCTYVHIEEILGADECFDRSSYTIPS